MDMQHLRGATVVKVEVDDSELENRSRICRNFTARRWSNLNRTRGNRRNRIDRRQRKHEGQQDNVHTDISGIAGKHDRPHKNFPEGTRYLLFQFKSRCREPWTMYK